METGSGNDGDGAPIYRPAGAMETDVILENLVSYLQTDDLKACRLVCKQWHKNSTPALERRIDITLHTSGTPVPCTGKQESKFIKDFEAVAKATAEAFRSTQLQPVKFKRALIYSYENGVCLTSLIKSDWVGEVVSLNLFWLSTQDFNGCITGILNGMTKLRHLGVQLFHRVSSSYTAIQSDLPENRIFRLESLVVNGALDAADSGFLEHCKNLKVLGLNFDPFSIEGRQLKWMEDFKNENYPRKITRLSIGFDELGDSNGHLDTSILSMLNLFQLEDLRLHVLDFAEHRRWDILQVLKRIKSKSLTSLALELATPGKYQALERIRILNVFKALSLPQYRKLINLKIAIVYKYMLDDHEQGPIAGAEGARITSADLADLKLTAVKNLVIKFLVGSNIEWPKGRVSILGILRIAAAKMPALESLNIDAYSAKALKDVLKVVGSFEGLKDLTLNGGKLRGRPKGRNVRADTLFGMWQVNRMNSFKGLFALKELKSLTLQAPTGTHLDKEAFERGFLRLPKLRKLRINPGALENIPQSELDSMDLGNLVMEHIVRPQEMYWNRLFYDGSRLSVLNSSRLSTTYY